MRTKILMITAMLAVMVAMTGIVSAQEIKVRDPITDAVIADMTLTPGTPLVEKLKIDGISSIDGLNFNLTDTVYKNLGTDASPIWVPSTDITVKYKEITGPYGIFGGDLLFHSETYNWARLNYGVTYEYLDVSFETSVINGKYEIYIYNKGTGMAEPIKVQVTTTSIPELPTVALPVALVIGLVFFFQQRKNKEE